MLFALRRLDERGERDLICALRNLAFSAGRVEEVPSDLVEQFSLQREDAQ
jgi:hypothetical protein